MKIWSTAHDRLLTVEGPFYDTSDSVLAITGEYAGARGEMRSVT